MAKNWGYCSIGSGIEDPPFQVQPTSDIQHRLDRFLLVTHVRYANRTGNVARVARNRRLVIDHTHGQTSPAQAARDAQTLKVSAKYNSTDALCRQTSLTRQRLRQRSQIALVVAIHWAVAIRRVRA